MVAACATALGLLLVLVATNLKSDTVSNADKITLGQLGLCRRLQHERDDRNRDSAVIYVVLQAVADNARTQNAREYARLARLPVYRPPTQCDRAVRDPLHYKPPDRVPFADVDGATLARALGVKQSDVLRAFGAGGQSNR